MEQTKNCENASAAVTLNLSHDERTAFIQAVKVGYFKEFYRRGLITAEQLDRLIAKQYKSINQPAT